MGIARISAHPARTASNLPDPAWASLRAGGRPSLRVQDSRTGVKLASKVGAVASHAEMIRRAVLLLASFSAWLLG